MLRDPWLLLSWVVIGGVSAQQFQNVCARADQVYKMELWSLVHSASRHPHLAGLVCCQNFSVGTAVLLRPSLRRHLRRWLGKWHVSSHPRMVTSIQKCRTCPLLDLSTSAHPLLHAPALLGSAAKHGLQHWQRFLWLRQLSRLLHFCKPNAGVPQHLYVSIFSIKKWHVVVFVATFTVARLTSQTRKLWCRDRPSSALP